MAKTDKTDGVQEFQLHRSQLAASLGAVAESMRTCATMADQFAAIVRNSSFSALSPINDMARNLNGGFTDSAASPETSPAPPAAGKRKAAAMDETDGAKAKRTRKAKDPNAPKRPASSYILFQNEVRKELKAQHPALSNPELLTMIAKQWSEMPDEAKAKYTQQNDTMKKKYSEDKAAYDARSPEEVAAAEARTAAEVALKKTTKRTRAPKKEKTEASVPARPPPVMPAVASAESSTDSDSDEESDDDEHHHVPVPPTKNGQQRHASATADSSSESEDNHAEDDVESDEEDEQDHEPTPKKQKKSPTPVPKDRRKKVRGASRS